MIRKIFFLLLIATISLGAKAGAYRIDVQWKGIKDTTIFLAHYFDTNIYVNDTIKLDSKGRGVFQGDSLLPQGLYLLYLNGDNFFDFLVGEKQNIKIKTVNKHLIDSITISGATETEAFRQYQLFLRKQSAAKNKYIDELKSSDSTIATNARQKIEQIDKEMNSYLSDAINSAGNNMFGAFLKAANPAEVPPPNVERNHPQYDSIAWFHAYNYRRDHFLEGIDFTDERLLRTPLLKPKLDTYFNKILIQSPDSIVPQAKKLLQIAEPHKAMYQYLAAFLLNNSVQSKIMGMDAVFVAIADEVYLSGKATWADSTQMAKIQEEVFLTRPNLIGNIAPEMLMETIDGETISLHQLHNDYTIIVFYEYDCGHCKKTVPALYNAVYLKFIDNNIDVFAVCMSDDHEKWAEFVEEHQLAGWHHVWDVPHRSLYRFKYNVRSSPMIYLIDKEKKIIAKKLDNENLVMLLNTLLNKK